MEGNEINELAISLQVKLRPWPKPTQRVSRVSKVANRNQYRFMIVLHQESIENYTYSKKLSQINLMQSFYWYFCEMIAQIPQFAINIHPRTISPLYVLRASNHFLIRNSNYFVIKPRTISTYPRKNHISKYFKTVFVLGTIAASPQQITTYPCLVASPCVPSYTCLRNRFPGS